MDASVESVQTHPLSFDYPIEPNQSTPYPLQLCAGLCCGLSGLAAGGCIGIIGDYGVRSVGYRTSNISVIFSTDKSGFDDNAGEEGSNGDENKLFVGMLIMLIFSEALAL